MKKILKQSVKKLPFYVIGYLGAEMKNAKVSKAYKSGISDTPFSPKDATWQKGSVLRSKSGALLNSYIPGRKNSKSKINTSKDNITATFESGLPYAEIHETGGFIKSKGRMHNYFWAMYMQHKNEFYKIMALSVLKRGGVKIPKRPYFIPGMNKMESEGMDLWLKELMDYIEEAWRGSKYK